MLGLGVNGLSVARALASKGVEVHGVWSGGREPGRYSRHCRTTAVAPVDSEQDFVEWLSEHTGHLDRPVVLPTSDRFALWLARHRPRLAETCRLWTNGAEVVESLIRKDRFYSIVTSASLRSPAFLVAPEEAELRPWCALHPGPYLIKPFHEDALSNPLGAKNRVAPTADELLAFSAEPGLAGLLVQRMLRGGDGWHYTVAGLCERSGRLRALVTKRKLIQYPPDRGIVAHACIPACDTAAEETVFLDATKRLLGAVRYHGLFGCEWLKERASGEIFALDFNPRSLYGNSHILAAGVNLPYLAYRDLCGDELTDIPERPAVRRVLWADAWGCAGAWSRLRGTGRLSWRALLSAVLASNAHAVWSWRDPLPGLVHSTMQFAQARRSRRDRQ